MKVVGISSVSITFEVLEDPIRPDYLVTPKDVRVVVNTVSDPVDVALTTYSLCVKPQNIGARFVDS